MGTRAWMPSHRPPRDSLQNLLQVVVEPSEQHVVRLVNRECADLAERDGAHLEQGDEPAGRGHQQVRTARQRALLVADLGPGCERAHTHAAAVREPFGLGRDLLDEVARGSLPRGPRVRREEVKRGDKVNGKEDGVANDSSAVAR